MQIIVDTYDESEAAMSWHCYLQDTITFPFKAKCIKKVSTLFLSLNFFEKVKLIRRNGEKNCQKSAEIGKFGEEEVKLKRKCECCEKRLILGLERDKKNSKNSAETDLEAGNWRFEATLLRTHLRFSQLNTDKV